MKTLNTDKDLVWQCHNGSEFAFNELYDRYIKKIYDFIYYKTTHKQTAEDLTSKTFIKAWQNINKFDTNKGTFSAWIYQIARNNVIDYYRTQKSSINIEDVWDLSNDDNMTKQLDDNNKLAEVKEYLKDLKADQREIVIMRVWQQLSYREISEIMNKSEASCKMIFLRTIKKLRKELSAIIVFTIILMSYYI